MRIIDADALKKEIARLHILNDEKEIRRAYYANPHTTMADFEETLVGVFDCIDDAPTIEPKRGEWIDDGFAHRCSICGKQGVGIEYFNFCPNCGADMRAKEGE